MVEFRGILDKGMSEEKAKKTEILVILISRRENLGVREH